MERLNGFLEREPSDQEGWVELGLIYSQKGLFMKALFCFEELVILNPTNEDYTLKLAELYLTLGGKENEEKAMKYLSFLVSKRP